MGLSTEQMILIEQRVANEAKSTGVAYLLWFFLGGFGAHRIYIGRTGSGMAMLALLILGILTSFIYIGVFLLIALAIWLIVDIFLIPGMVDQQRNGVRLNLTQMAMMGTPNTK